MREVTNYQKKKRQESHQAEPERTSSVHNVTSGFSGSSISRAEKEATQIRKGGHGYYSVFMEGGADGS